MTNWEKTKRQIQNKYLYRMVKDLVVRKKEDEEITLPAEIVAEIFMLEIEDVFKKSSFVFGKRIKVY